MPADTAAVALVECPLNIETFTPDFTSATLSHRATDDSLSLFNVGRPDPAVLQEHLVGNILPLGDSGDPVVPRLSIHLNAWATDIPCGLVARFRGS